MRRITALPAAISPRFKAPAALSLALLLAPACLHAQISIQASATTVSPGGTITLKALQGAKPIQVNWSLDPEQGAGKLDPASDASTTTYTPPAQIGTHLAATGTVTIKAQSTDGQQSASIDITLTAGQEKAWEARSVIGFQQAAASAADSRLSYFMDFFIIRGLGDKDASTSRANLWGNVRLATIPQQFDVSVGSFLKNPASGASSLKVNQLVQSAEFLTGFEYRPGGFIWQGNPDHIRTLGLVIDFGASGPFNPKQVLSAVYVVPAANTPQGAQFDSQFKLSPRPAYVAFTTPDRQQFYKQWGAGVRVTTFDRQQPGNPPATYTATLGQDELITSGSLGSAVARFDVFYPLPLDIGGFKFLYLFGTALLRLFKNTQTNPLILQTAPSSIAATDPNVAIVTTQSTRDYYRVGFGVDVLAAIRQLTIKKK
jgi:hypothetical protein